MKQNQIAVGGKRFTKVFRAAGCPVLWVGCWFFVLATPVVGQTSYPMLMATRPAAVQVGTEAKLEILSRYDMFGAHQVLVSGAGVEGTPVLPDVKVGAKPPSLQKLTVRFKAEETAALGVRDFRLATPRGASTLGQLVVVRDPVIQESNQNNTPEKAEEVTLPATLCGVIERAEDVDYFKFHAAAGSVFTFHVMAMRLQDKIHDLQQHVDPILTLRSASGATLRVSDNYFFADPCLSHRFEQEGDYLLEIRDVRYQGNQYWSYCIEATSAPFVVSAHPLAVSPGEPIEVLPYGFGFELGVPGEVVAPETPADMQLLPLKIGEQRSHPGRFLVTERRRHIEAAGENDTPGSAERIEQDALICGRLEKHADLDCFRFAAKKGQRLSFEVIARRLRSEIDSHLRILDVTGKQLAVGDDLRFGKRSSSDSWIENWAAPSDGEYIVEIRDLHLNGGAGFPYLIRVTESTPYFTLFADTDKTQVTPGTAGVVFVRVERKNGFGGAIQLKCSGLPAGVTAACGRILADGNDGCIIFTAAADAKASVANVRISGEQIADDETVLTSIALPYQETYLPGGGRGHWPCQMHSVCVGEPGDIRALKLSSNEVQLRPGETVSIDVSLERAEGFDKNITLDVMLRHLNGVYGNPLPAGISIDGKASKTLLTGKESTGKIVLKADAKAKPVQAQQISVMANVSINFVMKATYSSEPVFVTINR